MSPRCAPAIRFPVEIEREDDGRWIADVPELPGCMAYGETSEAAVSRAVALALHVLADRIEHGEDPPDAETAAFALPDT